MKGCIIEEPEFQVQYKIKNNFRLTAKVFYFKNGYSNKFFSINSGEEYFLMRGNLKQGRVSGNLELIDTDSVKIEFSGGKSKIDYIQDYISSTSKSIYRDEYYVTENNCPNQSNCSQYIYTIDEQDYAEAK
jgi:hypothetical protein